MIRIFRRTVILCVWWNRYPCWRRKIVLKCDFLSYPLNSFWDVLVIIMHSGESSRMKSSLFRSIRMLHFLKKSLWGLGVGCITLVYFLLFLKRELTGCFFVCFCLAYLGWNYKRVVKLTLLRKNKTYINFSPLNGELESWTLLFS